MEASHSRSAIGADRLHVQKVTERTIYRLTAAKKIRAFNVGGSWRFSREDIGSWIKHQFMEGLGPSEQQHVAD